MGDDELSTKIVKLQEATDLAQQQLTICKEAYEKSTIDLETAKSKYKNMSPEQQQSTQINATELPELIETQLRAKNILETAQSRYETNLRYLNVMKNKQQQQK